MSCVPFGYLRLKFCLILLHSLIVSKFSFPHISSLSTTIFGTWDLLNLLLALIQLGASAPPWRRRHRSLYQRGENLRPNVSPRSVVYHDPPQDQEADSGRGRPLLETAGRHLLFPLTWLFHPSPFFFFYHHAPDPGDLSAKGKTCIMIRRRRHGKKILWSFSPLCLLYLFGTPKLTQFWVLFLLFTSFRLPQFSSKWLWVCAVKKLVQILTSKSYFADCMPCMSHK